MKTISDLIKEWYAEYSQEIGSAKGVTRVIPIKGMEEYMISLFHSIKELGYAEDDITNSVKNQIVKCCLPASIKGKARSGWEHNIEVRLIKAKMSVFGSTLKDISENITPEVQERYLKTYNSINLSDNKKTRDTIEKEPVHSNQEMPDEDFVETEFKPLDRSKLKESVPDVVEDDSWIHEMADSFDE